MIDLSKFFLNHDLFIAKVPDISELLSNQKKIYQIKQFTTKDFLSRSEVDTDLLDYNVCLKEQTVAITGGAGSIGSELCFQLLTLGAKKIVIIDYHEFSLFELIRNLQKKFPNANFKALICDIKNKEKLKDIFKKFQVSTVYHAAAFKHVDLVERNIIEAISNNFLGTLSCLNASQEAKVKKFVLISTDKAVNPTSIMGATKRMAEILVSSYFYGKFELNNIQTTIVRFGNVLRSQGSVIPILERQISQGGPVTITDPEVERYFMTINEAVKLVILASNLLENNKTYILDMGKPRKIIDMAKELILMNGYIPTLNKKKRAGEINIVFTGLKKGEKISEELYINKEINTTEIPKIKCVIEPNILKKELDEIIFLMQNCVDKNDEKKAKKIFVKYANYKSLEE